MIVMRYFVVLIMVVLVSGCAGFRAVEPLDDNAWPPAAGAEAPQPVNVVVTADILFNGTPVSPSAEQIDALQTEIIKVVDSSGVVIAKDFDSSSRVMEVNYRSDGTGNMPLHALSGFTFGVIPARAQEKLTLTTTFKDKQGNEIGEVVEQDTMTMWTQILMLPVGLVKNPFAELTKARDDMVRRSIIRARGEGYLTAETEASGS